MATASRWSARSKVAEAAGTAADPGWTVYGTRLHSRLLLGTAQYPSPAVLTEAIRASGTEVITLALRRQAPGSGGGEQLWALLRETGCHLLPNTAGCHSAQEAVTVARMARELFATSWIKLEVIGDDYNLQPDPFELITAAKTLVQEGFQVFPYCTDDLVLCQRLLDVGCELLMPWAAPIGTGQGLLNPQALETLRQRLKDVPLIVDAGIGSPSHAVQAMELGCDGVLLNTAVALAEDPVGMAAAFSLAVQAGHRARESGLMPARPRAQPSTPTLGTPFWQEESAG